MKFVIVWGGEIQNLGGKVSPPKGPEKKNTVSNQFNISYKSKVSARNNNNMNMVSYVGTIP